MRIKVNIYSMKSVLSAVVKRKYGKPAIFEEELVSIEELVFLGPLPKNVYGL